MKSKIEPSQIFEKWKIDFEYLKTEEWKSLSYNEKIKLVEHDVNSLLHNVNIHRGYGFTAMDESHFTRVTHDIHDLYIIFGFNIFKEPHMYAVFKDGSRWVTSALDYNTEDYNLKR